MKNIILVILCFLFVIVGNSQQRNLSQFFNASIYNNPAEAGIEHAYRFSTNYRKQWPSIVSGYETKVIGIDMYHKNLGYGIVVASNGAGANSLLTNSFLFNVSNQLKLNATNFLSVGMQFGLSQYSLNANAYKFESQYSSEFGFNPSIYSNENFTSMNTSNFTGGFGLSFRNISSSWSPTFSLALNNLFYSRNKLFLETQSNSFRLLNVSFSGSKILSKKITFLPYVFFAYQNQAYNFLVGSRFSYKLDSIKQFQIGLGVRDKDAYITYFGIQFQKILLGISYDVNTSKLKPGTSGIGAFEISLIAHLKGKPEYKTLPKKVRKPDPDTVFLTKIVTVPQPKDTVFIKTIVVDTLKYDTPIDINSIDKEFQLNRYYVYFDSDKSNLTTEYQKVITKLVSDVQGLTYYKILLYGHTDSDGEALYNIFLGQARANEVMHYLIENKISMDNIKTFTYGKSNPIVDNSTLAKKAKNRRVEIIVLTK